jgi:hypothetical protein
MLDPLFTEAWVHAPGGHTVLGRALHPLCALDLLQLEVIGSPFLLDGGRIEAADLILAVWILSNPHPADGSLGNLEPPADWVQSLAGTVDLKAECDRLVKYIEDYYSLPEIMRDVADNPMTPYGCPWMLGKVVTVARHLHVPLREAWTMPIGPLIWYCAALEEMTIEGSRVVGPDLRADMQAAKTAFKKMGREPDETDEAYAARVGVTVQQLRVMTLTGQKTKAAHG